MRAAITPAPQGAISVEEIAEPERRSGSVLVDLDLALFTAADWTTYTTGSDSLFPLVQGSGGVGTLASGGGSLIVGSRVAIWPRIACGRCDSCRAARRDLCADATTLGRDRDGTLAERVLVPRDNAVRVHSALSPDVAAAAVDYAGAWRLLMEAGVRRAGRRIAIVGSAPEARAARRLATQMRVDAAAYESAGKLAGDGPFDAIVAVAVGDVGSLIEDLAIEGTLVIRDLSSSEEASIDGAAVAERRAWVVGAGPGGRQDFVEVLRWVADERFSPPVEDTVRLDDLGRALARVGEVTIPVPVLLD